MWRHVFDVKDKSAVSGYSGDWDGVTPKRRYTSQKAVLLMAAAVGTWNIAGLNVRFLNTIV
jgi:hypothetical protein